MTEHFLLSDGRRAELYTLTDESGCRAVIGDLGGVIHRLEVPDRAGRMTDVVLGFADPADYERNPPYFGALIGRVANRIAGAAFELDGRTHRLIANGNGNSLHGGDGFSHRRWQMVEYTGDELELALTSPDGDAGYPGEVAVSARYRLRSGALTLELTGRATAPTLLSMTNHAYFNLNGEADFTLDDQELRLFADCRQEVDAALLPTGTLIELAGTAYDLRKYRSFAAIFAAVGKGLDDAFVDRAHPAGVVRKIAAARSRRTGITLEVSGSAPAVQVYTANFLDCPLPGKGGRPYPRRSAFCLESQMPNGAADHPALPSIRLDPGQVYRQTIVYAFGVDRD